MRLFCALVALTACTGPGDDDDTAADPLDGPYAFVDADGASTVAYSGQVMRQVLIDDLKRYLTALTARIDAGYSPAPGEVRADLDFYFAFDAESAGTIPPLLTTDPPLLQATYGDISDKNLVDKIAGNDSVGQHADWSTALVGAGDHSPQSRIEAWFDEIDAMSVDRANGRIPVGADGTPVPSVALSADGLDRVQLIEKFLRGAINFSQGADDYLDDDIDGKGLLADHTAPAAGKTYTELEHAWDEAFGYFGASRDYGLRSADEVADGAWFDTDDDGAIDLNSEMSWGHAVNAAKRDRGAVVNAEFKGRAWAAFIEGRAVIAAAEGPLDADAYAALQGHRDDAVAAWEQTLAANCVHYINDTLADLASVGTDDYGFADHAKHWSELKGFALALQFNPRSPMSSADFERLHTLIADAPALPGDGEDALADHGAALREARTLIGQVYGFNEQNLGDDDGEGGW